MPPSDCILASVPDSLEWSRGRRQKGLKKKGKKEGRRMADGVGAGGGRNRHGYWLLEVGVFCATRLWEEDEFAVKRADSG